MESYGINRRGFLKGLTGLALAGVCADGLCSEESKETSAEKDIQKFEELLKKGYHEEAYQMFVGALGDKYLPEKDRELRKHLFNEKCPFSYTLDDVVKRPLSLSRELLESIKNQDEYLKVYERGNKRRISLFKLMRDPESVIKNFPEKWQKSIRNYKIPEEKQKKGGVWKVDNEKPHLGDQFYFWIEDVLVPAIPNIASGLGMPSIH